jgi:hypothetical protein
MRRLRDSRGTKRVGRIDVFYFFLFAFAAAHVHRAAHFHRNDSGTPHLVIVMPHKAD